MAKFHKLKVSDVRQETADCVSVAFDIPQEIAGEFKFIQGQYLTLKMNIDGEEVRRSYSLCSSPVTENDVRIAAKLVPNGKMSTVINQSLKVGDEIEVMVPMGNFYSEINENNKKHYLLFCGGSGVTPIFSILKTALAVEKESRVTMIYANRNVESVVFGKDINELVQVNADRFKIYNVYDQGEVSDPVFLGIMTSDKVKELVDRFVDVSDIDEVFVCGPGVMMENIIGVLDSVSVPKEKVHVEYFEAVLKQLEDVEEKASVAASGGVINSKVTIIMDDEETTIELKSNGEAILDAALESDLDVPFACKGAVCCTCKAKVMKGKVEMEMNYSLSDAEVEEGYILTCQSHPQSEEVVVSFDEP